MIPGQLVSEIELSKRYGVGRQAVREAFISLGHERLIEVRPNRGTYIRKISMKEVLGAWHVREAIEVSIVRQLAKQHDVLMVERLRQCVAAQRKCHPEDKEAFLVSDDAFHLMLAHEANREFAWGVIDSAKAQMDRVCYLSYDLASPLDELVGDHGVLLDAIAANNARLAVNTIELHLRRILAALPAVAEKYPDYFVDESPRDW